MKVFALLAIVAFAAVSAKPWGYYGVPLSAAQQQQVRRVLTHLFYKIIILIFFIHSNNFMVELMVERLNSNSNMVAAMVVVHNR